MTLVKRREFQKKNPNAATKGSQLWLQLLVGEPGNRWLLDAELARHIPGLGPGTLEWRSPLGPDFSEYRDGAFLHGLDLGHLEAALVHSAKSAGFWPARGPVWDGLAVGPKGLKVLVEAKAHVPEIAASGTQASKPSRAVIDAAFDQVKQALGVKAGDWTGPLYQHANRVAHLWWLREQQDVDAHLVFLYFIGADKVGGPSSRARWEGAIELEEKVLGLPKRHLLRPYVHHVFFDVTPLKP